MVFLKFSLVTSTLLCFLKIELIRGQINFILQPPPITLNSRGGSRISEMGGINLFLSNLQEKVPKNIGLIGPKN